MKTASVRQIQHHFRNVLSWVKDGEEVEITSNRRVVARLLPARTPKTKRTKRPDFAARLKRISGGTAPLSYNPIVREREEGRW